MNRLLKSIATAALVGWLIAPGTVSAGRLWLDGSRDDETTPPGALLSDNPGYWGDSVHTGVTYTYETEPDAPADAYGGKAKGKLGTTHVRLLDGIVKKEMWWGGSVGIANKPLVIDFDFKQVCGFKEFDLCSIDLLPMEITIEAKSGDKDDWKQIYHRDRPEKETGVLKRAILPAAAAVRFVRVSVQQDKTTSLIEFLAWGSAGATQPEVAPVAGNLQSIQGIPATKFTEQDAQAWKQQFGQQSDVAVWSAMATWDRLSYKPVLPGKNDLLSNVNLVLPRNGTESIAIALTNTNIQAASRLNVRLTDVRKLGDTNTADGIHAKLGIFGAMISRNYGAVESPILYADNLPGKSLLRASLVNAAVVEEFPSVNLPPAGSAVLWLTVDTDNVPAGNYVADIHVEGAADLPLTFQVLDVTLPEPFHWMQVWSEPTSMFPFQYDDRLPKEVAFMQSLGINVWDGLPTPGSKSDIARQRGGQIVHTLILPGKYVGGGWSSRLHIEDLKDADYDAIRQHVSAVVQQAKELGLSYNDWYGELWDEPSRRNLPVFAHLAKFVKSVDPKIMLVANPPFWENGGMIKDDVSAFQCLDGWYDQIINVSCPSLIAYQVLPKCDPLFNAPRWINAAYQTTTQMSKNEENEELNRYRMGAWDAFSKGWNGWAAYAYYRPTSSPWNDCDGDDRGFEGEAPDYQLVFPGPLGPIPTRPAFGLQAGWEDYRLLSLLKSQGQDEFVSKLLAAYATKSASYSELRIRALQQAAKAAAH